MPIDVSIAIPARTAQAEAPAPRWRVTRLGRAVFQRRAALSSQIAVADPVEAVSPHPVIPPPMGRHRIPVSMRRERGEESSVEHRHAHRFGQQVIGGSDTRQVGRVVEGGKPSQLFDRFCHRPVDHDRLREPVAAVDNPVPDRHYLSRVGQGRRRSVFQERLHQVPHTLPVGIDLRLDRNLPVIHSMTMTSPFAPHSLDDSCCKRATTFHFRPVQAVLDG